MSSIICLQCANTIHFTTEIETVKEVTITPSGLQVGNAVFDGWDYSQTFLRDNLDDMVRYILFENNAFLQYDPTTERFFNTCMTCARCGSTQVTKRFCEWNPRALKSVDTEIIENRNEYKKLRKERYRNENLLPVLFKQ